MKATEFLNQLQHHEIIAAIGAAEAKTSGEIRVFISHKNVENPVAVAESEFARLGMMNTRDRNGVLIFVAPLSQNFAVIGDQAVHRLWGEIFWRELAAEMTVYFQRDDFTSGIIDAIHKAGELLAAKFPRRSDDVNELPNEVERD